MPLEILEVHFDCAGSQNLGVRGGCLSPLPSRCGAVRIFGQGSHFSSQTQGKPCVLGVHIRLFVTCARDRSGVTSKCRLRGRRIVLDMVVIFDALSVRDRYSEP